MREIDWVGLRADLTVRKAKAIDDMPELIERFTREAEAVGAKVYRAVDAEEARRIVTAICRAHSASRMRALRSLSSRAATISAMGSNATPSPSPSCNPTMSASSAFSDTAERPA